MRDICNHESTFSFCCMPGFVRCDNCGKKFGAREMNKPYIANSLEDIAKHFDLLKENATKGMMQRDITLKERAEYLAEKKTWQSAATILRQTELVKPNA